MPETNTQKKYKDVTALHKAGVPLTPSQLADVTDRSAEDFSGVQVAQHSEALAELVRGKDKRLLDIAGMADNPNGPIGFALILEDLKRLFSNLKRKK